LDLQANCQKFKKYSESGGLFYAAGRGVRYFIFLLKKHREMVKQLPDEPKNSISKGKIKIACSDCGISIFWNDSEISNGAGLNVAINTAGLWTDSVKADWQVVEKGEDYVQVKVIFRDLPLNQSWRLKIRNNREIDWHITMEVEEWLHIDEFRILCLTRPQYKNWINNCQEGYFPRLDNYWHDLCLDGQPTSLVGAKFPLGNSPLPAFVMEAEDKMLFPLVQSTPLDTNTHILGFRRIVPEEKKDHPAGRYRLFSGTIGLFEDNSPLDATIENLRHSSLEEVTKETARGGETKRQLKILLANLPWQRDGMWGVRAGSRWPHIRDEKEGEYLPYPFFLAYATSLLRKHAIDAVMIDAIAEQTAEDRFVEKITGMGFDYVVAETSIPSFYDDLRMLKKIHEKGIAIILCGPNAEIYKPEFLKENPFVKFVLYGEYEFSLLNLVTCLQEGGDLSKVKGLMYRDNAIIKKNFPSEPRDINLLPWPYREDLPMHAYLDAPGEMLTPSVQIMASRGCPFKCQFCLWPQVMYQGHHYRARDVKDVVDEMEYLVKEKGFKSVYFDDDTFNIGKERMLDFCREIRERGLDKTQWSIMARPDLMDKEILQNMKAAGLWAVKYGVESASQSLVDSIDKNMDLRKTEEMVKLTRKLAIRVHLTFTFGLPGETKATIEKTIRYALKLNPFSLQFSIATPFPGTEYYRILEKQNAIVTRDLSRYDGHCKSVIKLETLTPEELQHAKERAYRIWSDHVRKRRGSWGNVKRFYTYTQTQGLRAAAGKAMKYLSSEGQ
jgi:anaerobic magnesium-protoporphyrin IX monomethyl ester cyclase